jgi:hypothetical protein
VNVSGNNLGNFTGTCSECIGNKEEKQKLTSLAPHPQKEKIGVIGDCMLMFLIGCMRLLFSKLFVIIFGLG